jgi:hypothetical protein
MQALLKMSGGNNLALLRFQAVIPSEAEGEVENGERLGSRDIDGKAGG